MSFIKKIGFLGVLSFNYVISAYADTTYDINTILKTPNAKDVFSGFINELKNSEIASEPILGEISIGDSKLSNCDPNDSSSSEVHDCAIKGSFTVNDHGYLTQIRVDNITVYTPEPWRGWCGNGLGVCIDAANITITANLGDNCTVQSNAIYIAKSSFNDTMSSQSNIFFPKYFKDYGHLTLDSPNYGILKLFRENNYCSSN